MKRALSIGLILCFCVLALCFTGSRQDAQTVVRRPIPAAAGACSVGTDISNGWCQIAHKVAGSANTTSATTAAADTTGADLIVGVVSYYCVTHTMVVGDFSDNKSNTWTSITAQCDLGGGQGILIIYSKPSSVGSGHTFTVSNAAVTFPVIEYYAVSGSHASPLDQTAGASSAGSSVTSLATSSITPSQNNELIISGWTLLAANTGTPSINAGMTISDFLNSDGVNYQTGGLAYKTQSTAAAINATWSWNVSGPAYAAIVSFKHS